MVGTASNDFKKDLIQICDSATVSFSSGLSP